MAYVRSGESQCIRTGGMEHGNPDSCQHEDAEGVNGNGKLEEVLGKGWARI
jgi:hypothetical protein